MDEQTKAALRSSIDIKWKGIRFRGGEDKGIDDCDLCSLFYYSEIEEEENCSGCPVKEKTRKKWCKNTPYILWIKHQNRIHGFLRVVHPDCEECEILCDAQIAFLESLLPNNRKV